MSEESLPLATPSQTVGPFFHFGLCTEPINRLADRLPPGESVRLSIRITDGDAQPVGDALVEVCQAGVFGRMATGEDGICEFETIRSTAGLARPAERPADHLDVCLFARGLLRQLHTRIYFAGDPALERDQTLAAVPEHRRGTLLAKPDAEIPGRWVFDLRLQGPGETVFFDV